MVVGLVAGQRERLTDKGPAPPISLVSADYESQINIHSRLAADAWAAAARSCVLSATSS